MIIIPHSKHFIFVCPTNNGTETYICMYACVCVRVCTHTHNLVSQNWADLQNYIPPVIPSMRFNIQRSALTTLSHIFLGLSLPQTPFALNKWHFIYLSSICITSSYQCSLVFYSHLISYTVFLMACLCHVIQPNLESDGFISCPLHTRPISHYHVALQFLQKYYINLPFIVRERPMLSAVSWTSSSLFLLWLLYFWNNQAKKFT